jgi:hypothetical protein
MCGLGFLMIAFGGPGALAPGLAFATFSAGFALWGWHAMRARTRSTAHDPEVLPVPKPVGEVLTIKKTPAPGLIPLFCLTAFGWAGVVFSAASELGFGRGEGSIITGLLIFGLFALLGHGVLIEHAVSLKLNLREGTWELRKGVWPMRRCQRGDLAEASHVAVAREARLDEGSEYEVLVAKLVWRDGWYAPLLLCERPNSVDALRYGGQTLRLDYRGAIMRWGSEMARLLDLPLTDETKKPCGA